MSEGNDDLRFNHLIDAAELFGTLASPNRPVLLDIRFRLGGPDRRQEYLEGHIPGAVFVDLPTELAGEEKGFSGRRPLPDIRDLQRDARRWGIGQGDAVVVYDNNYGQQAARAWWVLRWAGIKNVRLLNGGFAAWLRAGLPVSRDVALPAYGDVSLSPGNLPTLTADEASALARSGILVDARDAGHYQGAPREAGKPAEGHIPGSINVPTTGNLSADGLFEPSDALKQRFAAVGIDKRKRVGAYCGGGVTATHQILALATVGIDAALFPGSWSAWSSDPSRPVATGPEPQ
ncbi:sulfurtransferase [Mesorhizobium sp. 1B3]|uniref:sulfurtransferase n=1 Tax=Mesorhizobium sp. 1B3 TaxID=3243599 RepID=UPI003D964553